MSTSASQMNHIEAVEWFHEFIVAADAALPNWLVIANVDV